MPRAIGVIPARFESTRFRGKPLAPLGDGVLVEAVWRRTVAARSLERVLVATDDERILRACGEFGAEARMTSTDHASGTDRIAEVAREIGEEFDIVVNVQGDEPLVTPTSLDTLVGVLAGSPDAPMATLYEPMADPDELLDPNVVKVVTDSTDRALYFSRSPIPFHRGPGPGSVPDLRSALAGRAGGMRGYRKHQGIYAYRREALLELAAMPVSPLERDEGLEQLRALEAGWTIRLAASDFRSVGVDTPEDLERVSAMLNNQLEDASR